MLFINTYGRQDRQVKRLLFVCVENACRSQMAEGFFNALSSGKAVAKSAGNMPAEKVNPLSIEVMREVGIDISKHMPKLITAEMVKEADKVILMGCGGNACPTVPKEVIDWQIEDPVGKGIEKFREVRNLIRGRVEELLIELGTRSKQS